MNIRCGRFKLNLDFPKMMGIINMTPDSFSDGLIYSYNTISALKYAEKLVEEGADLLDIGGESSRPGAGFVSEYEEWSRVKDVLTEVKSWNIPISLDTRRSYVMQKAIENDCVDIINDIEALQGVNSLEVVRQAEDIAVILMHMQGQPQTMQIQPVYKNVVVEVADFLKNRIEICEQNKISRNRIIVDPGIGFGKNLSHNLHLIRGIDYLIAQLQCPLLIGVSRKSMLQEITREKNPVERIGSGIIAEIEAVKKGAKLIRTHNIKQSKQAILTYFAINDA